MFTAYSEPAPGGGAARTNARDADERVHGHGVTFAILKAKFPALQKSECEQLKREHGSNDDDIVKALSAEHDGWTTVCKRKERRGPVAAAAVRVRRQRSDSRPVTSAVIVSPSATPVAAVVVTLKAAIVALDYQAYVLIIALNGKRVVHHTLERLPAVAAADRSMQGSAAAVRGWLVDVS